MQIESLKVFCDVARYRSFSKAARANGLTQSAASQAVSHLEKRLEVQLIDRSTRPLQLTPVGRVYYDGCQKLVDQYREYLELEASLCRSRVGIAHPVEVAAIYSVGLGDMGRLVERFTAREPGARVHVEYLHPDRVYEKVRAGTADLGLVSFPGKSRDLVALPWREEVMVLTCAPGHPLAAERAVKPAQLAGVKFVGFDKDLVIRRQVDRYLRDNGVAADVAVEFDNIETIKKAVEVSAGVALLPEPTVRREVREGSLVALPLEGRKFVRPLGIIYRRGHKPGAAAQRFIDLLREPGRDEAFDHVGGNGRANGPSRRPKKTG